MKGEKYILAFPIFLPWCATLSVLPMAEVKLDFQQRVDPWREFFSAHRVARGPRLC